MVEALGNSIVYCMGFLVLLRGEFHRISWESPMVRCSPSAPVTFLFQEGSLCLLLHCIDLVAR